MEDIVSDEPDDDDNIIHCRLHDIRSCKTKQQCTTRYTDPLCNSNEQQHTMRSAVKKSQWRFVGSWGPEARNSVRPSARV